MLSSGQLFDPPRGDIPQIGGFCFPPRVCGPRNAPNADAHDSRGGEKVLAHRRMMQYSLRRNFEDTQGG